MSKSKPSPSIQKNVINTVMCFLPDNRPVTSIQIVEDCKKCPKNFFPIHKTFDMDSDADLWRESLLFGKLTLRYLCLSKTEGIQDFIIETIRVIGEKETPPEGFSLLTKTADSSQKAWRKKQIVYKLTKRSAVVQAVTDIILCSKVKTVPHSFQLAGEINGIMLCFKMGPLDYEHRQPPPVPPKMPTATTALTSMNDDFANLNLYTKPQFTNNDVYRNVKEISSMLPQRAAPKPPVLQNGTMNGIHADVDGIPFVLNPNLSDQKFDMPLVKLNPIVANLGYDFSLERQILCTIKSKNDENKMKNPFFH